jgi:hypothetical protein
MTDAVLQGIALQTLNIAKQELEQKETFTLLIAAYQADFQPPLHRMKKVEQTIVERLGQDWLNYEETKDVGFGVLRSMIDITTQFTQTPQAVVMVTACNVFKPTKKLLALPVKEQEKLVRKKYDDHYKRAIKEGWFIMSDGLTAVAQDPARVCIYTQLIDANHQYNGAPEQLFFDQSDFHGRMKMYGGPQEEPQ